VGKAPKQLAASILKVAMIVIPQHGFYGRHRPHRHRHHAQADLPASHSAQQGSNATPHPAVEDPSHPAVQLDPREELALHASNIYGPAREFVFQGMLAIHAVDVFAGRVGHTCVRTRPWSLNHGGSLVFRGVGPILCADRCSQCAEEPVAVATCPFI